MVYHRQTNHAIKKKHKMWLKARKGIIEKIGEEHLDDEDVLRQCIEAVFTEIDTDQSGFIEDTELKWVDRWIIC